MRCLMFTLIRMLPRTGLRIGCLMPFFRYALMLHGLRGLILDLLPGGVSQHRGAGQATKEHELIAIGLPLSAPRELISSPAAISSLRARSAVLREFAWIISAIRFMSTWSQSGKPAAFHRQKSTNQSSWALLLNCLV